MDNAKSKPALIAVEGELGGHQWVVHGPELIIGRGGNCDIVLPEQQVSREHVRIWEDQGRYLVQDLGSKNGTHVNGEPLTWEARELREGDEIQIALCVKLKFIGSEATVPLTITPGETDKGLHVDTASRQVTIGGQGIEPPLSLHQYRLLALLASEPGRVFTRDEVVAVVWPEDEGEGVSEQAIDALVRRLRDRLAELDPDHRYVVTVRGHGFRLENV
jgi:predicted component of type VI protein secretion system